MNLYNEIEPYAAEWMRNLAQEGHIANGTVDERSIVDLRPADVAGATQFHAFAGLGAWSYALRLAGWPDDRQVWTGSCPCQPFSGAGRKGGFDDERHLWPAWFELIRKCRPPVIFGEQVASPDGLAWLDAVSADLEGAGYAFGAADLCAAGIGAPHIRQRLYFVAYDNAKGRKLERPTRLHGQRQSRDDSSGRGKAGELGDARRERGGRYARAIPGPEGKSKGEWVAARDLADEPVVASTANDVADRSSWDDAEWLPCRDGKSRPVEPGTFPLAHGATARVGRLRAYGNAIVPEVAATFIRAVISTST